MATTAPVTVDAPRVTPALGGLLAVADIVEASDPHTAFGIEYQSFLCEIGGVVAGCVDAPAGVPTDDVKEFTGSHIVTGVPVTVYAGVECDLFGGSYVDQARDRLAGSEERLVAQGFYAHAALGQWSEAASFVGAEITQDNVVEAVARLEEYAGENYAGTPVLHMSRYTATLAIAEHVVTGSLDGSLMTYQGTPVANSAGYPDGVIFVTGAVHLWRTATAVYEAANTGANTSMALAERTYVLSTDCLLAIAGPDTAPPQPIVTVPSPITVTTGEQTQYTTRLQNPGGAIEDMGLEIRLHSDQRALVPQDVIYETHDQGTWTTVTWTVEGGDLVYREVLPVPAGHDATSQVRITVVAQDLTSVTGTSTATDGDGDVLYVETYEYVVVPPSADAPTITSVVPNTGPVAGGTQITITGTGFEE